MNGKLCKALRRKALKHATEVRRRYSDLTRTYKTPDGKLMAVPVRRLNQPNTARAIYRSMKAVVRKHKRAGTYPGLEAIR